MVLRRLFSLFVVAIVACGGSVVATTGAGSTSGDDDSSSSSAITSAPAPSTTTNASDTGLADDDTTTSDASTSDATTDDGSETGVLPPPCESVDCDDGDPCTIDTCDEATGRCITLPGVGLPCDDGDACTEDDACHPDGTCLGTPTCPMEHCGWITQDEVWGPDRLHILTCDVPVHDDSLPTLTILDGTTVLADPGVGLGVGNGRLHVLGGAQGVLFSSTEPVPVPGSWEGLRFSGVGGSTISHATIEYAGGGNAEGGVEIVGAWTPDGVELVAIDHSTVRYSLDVGILAEQQATFSVTNTIVTSNGGDGVRLEDESSFSGPTPSFAGNTITDNKGWAVDLGAQELGELAGSSTYAGNAGGVRASGFVDASATWHALDVEIRLDPVYVEYAPWLSEKPVEVIVEAGAKLSGWLQIGMGPNDLVAFHALGTAATPIEFRDGSISMSEDPSSPTSEFEHVEFDAMEISIWAGNFSFHDTEVRNSPSTYAAVYVDGAVVYEIRDSVFADNPGLALRLVDRPVAPFVGNVLQNNETPLRATGWAIDESFALSTFAGNANDYVEIESEVGIDTTWPALDVPYRLAHRIDVGGSYGVPATLVIEPGAVVELSQGLQAGNPIQLYPTGVAQLVGGIQAIGTPTNPIIFRGPEGGFAAGIDILDFASPSVFDYCVLENAWGNATSGAFDIWSPDVTITNSTITDSQGWAIYQHDGVTATISGNTYAGNAQGDVFPLP